VLPSTPFATRTSSSQANSNKGRTLPNGPDQRTPHKRSKKEARFATDVNHRISKAIVAEAARPGPRIARERLVGIRDPHGPPSPRRRWTLGACTSSGWSSTTKLNELVCLWLTTPLPIRPSNDRDMGTSTGRTVPIGTPSYAPGAPRRSPSRPERSHQHRHRGADGWAVSHAAPPPSDRTRRPWDRVSSGT